MPKVTEAYLAARRQQILVAAIACFARKGFHQTTMEDIGREARLSPGVAYRYFASKDDIIAATVLRSPNFFETVDESDVPLVLEALVNVYFERAQQPGRDTHDKVRVQLWAESLQNPRVKEQLLVLRTEALEQFAAVISKGQEAGQIHSDLDALAVATAITSLLDGFRIHRLADPDLDIGQHRDAFMAMVQGLFVQASTMKGSYGDDKRGNIGDSIHPEIV